MPSPPSVVLHLGLGAFHRAHQAVYLQRLFDAGVTDWFLASGNLRPDPSGTVEALVAQHGLYTLETVDPHGDRRYAEISAIGQVVAWDPGLAGLIEIGAHARTRVVSFTVTEAGYHLDPTHRLLTTATDVAADLHEAAAGRPGTTLYGALTALLRERVRAGGTPVTLLSCDNLRHNGRRSREGLLQFLQALGDNGLADWVRKNTSWPDSMVDRITPRPTPDIAGRVRAATGRDDGAALMSEAFIQWVIEDRFIAGRPPWEQVGVELVTSVEPYDEAKIRPLNATHSCLAWAGTLAGYTYIHEGAHDAEIAGFARRYAGDAIAALEPSPIDLAAYRDGVLERFGNPHIRDTNARVAGNSYAKLAGFVAPTVRDRLRAGAAIDAVAVLPALYLAHLRRWDAGALPYAYDDDTFGPAAAHALCRADDPVAALAGAPALWGEMAGDQRLVAAMRRAVEQVGAFESSRR